MFSLQGQSHCSVCKQDGAGCFVRHRKLKRVTNLPEAAFWGRPAAVWDPRPDRRTRRALLHLQYSCAAPCGPAMLVTQDPERSTCINATRCNPMIETALQSATSAVVIGSFPLAGVIPVSQAVR